MMTRRTAPLKKRVEVDNRLAVITRMAASSVPGLFVAPASLSNTSGAHHVRTASMSVALVMAILAEMAVANPSRPDGSPTAPVKRPDG